MQIVTLTRQADFPLFAASRTRRVAWCNSCQRSHQCPELLSRQNTQAQCVGFWIDSTLLPQSERWTDWPKTRRPMGHKFSLIFSLRQSLLIHQTMSLNVAFYLSKHMDEDFNLGRKRRQGLWIQLSTSQKKKSLNLAVFVEPVRNSTSHMLLLCDLRICHTNSILLWGIK